ncbi:ABC-type transport auxiliary lipoprotein family protein [Sulfurimonas sp.]|uniref:ABC-type transport auxiliary lipoprotein family protein n=1 Tax=Sulfurimonas sp. TaxID=2022749 RepID=UPI0025F2F783|nr:ABC-type transport auxiliary lipoprotein family protein [Sulfurimonas sp.]
MIRISLAIMLIFIISACSTTEPAVTEYKLSQKALKHISSFQGCKDKSLKVSQAFSSSSLMSLQMKYVLDGHKIYSYSQAQWSNSPNQEVSSQVVKVLRESKLFKNTQNSKSRSKSDLILEINIEDFMQYYSKNIDQSYVNVEISFTLIDSKTSEVIATNTFRANEEVITQDASGGVKALDAALSDILVQGLNSLNEVCK